MWTLILVMQEGGALPPTIARAWRTFDVAKQIEFESKEREKAEEARLQKIRLGKKQKTWRGGDDDSDGDSDDELWHENNSISGAHSCQQQKYTVYSSSYY